MSDILLLIVDARYPSAMMPPSLVRSLGKKSVILVLNKVDLIPAGLALAWKSYFMSKFPNMNVTFFTSCPAYNLRKASYVEGLQFRKLRGRISMAKEGALAIYETVESLVKGRVDLSSWQEKIVNYSDNEDPETGSAAIADEKSMLTLGMVGQPNVGKSSLINSLVGRRVVSVSKTPGHTKHFQEIKKGALLSLKWLIYQSNTCNDSHLKTIVSRLTTDRLASFRFRVFIALWGI